MKEDLNGIDPETVRRSQKKGKKSELENQWRAFKETRNRQKQNLALFQDFEKVKEQVKRIRPNRSATGIF